MHDLLCPLSSPNHSPSSYPLPSEILIFLPSPKSETLVIPYLYISWIPFNNVMMSSKCLLDSPFPLALAHLIPVIALSHLFCPPSDSYFTHHQTHFFKRLFSSNQCLHSSRASIESLPMAASRLNYCDRLSRPSIICLLSSPQTSTFISLQINGSQPRVILPPRRHLKISGDIFYRHQ